MGEMSYEGSASIYPIGASWSIGILAGLSPLNLSDLNGVVNPVLTREHVTDVQAAFVGDPFLIYEAGMWYMFFEALVATSLKGVISVAVSRDCRRWDYRGVALEESFHLSYPYVFSWRGAYYMMPETYGVGCIRLYRSRRFPFEWVHEAELITGDLADSSIFRSGGQWWILACGRPEEHDQLRLFHADRLFGPWTEHICSPIIDRNPHISRPGGRVINWGGRLIRFAQDCYPTYGLQVHALSICTLTSDAYSEIAAAPHPIVGPGRGWNSMGMHHVDACRNPAGPGWIASVDGLGVAV
jgi:hypothetical protein